LRRRPFDSTGVEVPSGSLDSQQAARLDRAVGFRDYRHVIVGPHYSSRRHARKSYVPEEHCTAIGRQERAKLA
jgi:hypothetical protein